jgi:hypothetical protein
MTERLRTRVKPRAHDSSVSAQHEGCCEPAAIRDTARCDDWGGCDCIHHGRYQGQGGAATSVSSGLGPLRPIRPPSRPKMRSIAMPPSTTCRVKRPPARLCRLGARGSFSARICACCGARSGLACEVLRRDEGDRGACRGRAVADVDEPSLSVRSWMSACAGCAASTAAAVIAHDKTRFDIASARLYFLF